MEKHFGTTVYVYNKNIDKFLFVKHKKLGKWVQPGGHVELNETPEECALREVYEETGLKVEFVGKRFPTKEDYITPFALQKNIINENHIHVDFVYLTLTNEEKIVLNIDESDDIKWFSKEEILSDDFQTFDKQKIWIKYFSEEIIKEL